MDRLTDFNLSTGVVIKAENDWRGVEWPQVAMHRNCHIFQLLASCLIYAWPLPAHPLPITTSTSLQTTTKYTVTNQLSDRRLGAFFY